MSDIEKAKELLLREGYSCVLCKNGKVYTSGGKGVSPMLEWIDSGMDLRGSAAADKIVGKAAAMLFTLVGIKEVYAPVMSGAAIDALDRFEISYSYDVRTEKIVNPAGVDCPMEQAVKDIQEPSEAIQAIVHTREKLMRRA